MKLTIDLTNNVPSQLEMKIKYGLLTDLFPGERGIFYSQQINSIMKGVREGFNIFASTQSTNNKNVPLKQIKFKIEDYIKSDLQSILELSIDTAMNQNVHSTTLERISDYIMEVCVDISEQQKMERAEAKKNKANPITLKEVISTKLKIK